MLESLLGPLTLALASLRPTNVFLSPPSSPPRWLRFDDGAVSSPSQQEVLHSRPYLLLYQRLGPAQ